MRGFYVYLILIISVFSCKNEAENTDLIEKNKQIEPVVLSLEQHYELSPFNNKPIDKIKFRNENFQTGKFMDIDEFVDTVYKTKPLVGNLTTVSVKNNQYLDKSLKILEDKENIEFQWSSINDSFNINNLEFKDLVGTTYPMKLPKISKMLKPVFKDNANYNIKYLDVEQGLKSSYLWTTCEDSKGQLWIGSNGSGLTMYNGEDLFDYSKTNECLGNYVWKIIEDSDKNIWLSTWGNGIIKFDGEHFYHYNVDNGFYANDIQNLFEDSFGNIWIGSYSKGIAIIRNGQISVLKKETGLNHSEVECFEEDSNGNIYVGCNNLGFFKIGQQGIQKLTSSQIDSKNIVFSIEYIENSNSIVFSLDNLGVGFLHKNELKILTKEDGLRNNRVQYIYKTIDNGLCFSFFRDGIQIWNNQSVNALNVKNGLSNSSVLQMNSADESKIWICTDGGGLNILKPNSFRLINENVGFTEHHVNCSAQLNDSSLIFGTEKGLVRYYNDRYEYFKELEDFNIVKIHKINDEYYWLATSQGVIKIIGDKFFLWNNEAGLQDHVIQDVIEDEKGNLWIGTYDDGLYYLNTRSDEVKLINHKAFEFNLGIWSSFIDSDNTIYIGTWSYGVMEIKNDSIRLLTMNEGLSSNNILSIEKIDNTLILGTNNRGVNFIEDNQIFYLTSEEGLPDQIIWDISVLNDQIWLGTEHGLVKLVYNTDINKMISELSVFDSKDGLKGVDAYANSLLFDNKGDLWFASGKGLLFCSKEALEQNNSVPKIMFENLEINETNYDFRNNPKSAKFEFDSILPFQNIPKGLTLRYNQNNVIFHFVGIDWENNENIEYSYRLLGSSEIWSNPKSEAKAEYKNLPPGDYTFELRARSKNNNWSETINLEFSIDNPWWTSWWAKTLYILTSVLIIILVIYFRNRKAVSRRKELENEINRATKEIRNQKEQIEKTRDDKIKLSQRIIEQDKYILLNQTANTIAHELNSPLGIIKNGDVQISTYLDEILSQIIPECSKATIMWCRKNAKFLTSNFSIDNQKIRNKRLFKKWFEENYNSSEYDTEILQALYSSELKDEHKTLIDFILQSEDPLHTIKLLNILCRIEIIKKMTGVAAEKCIDVIGSLTKALNVEQLPDSENVNIVENLNSVIELFVDEKVEFNSNISKESLNSYFKGSEFGLFQMWYNLISLLKESNNVISISTENNTNSISIVFSVENLQFDQIEQFEGIFDFSKTDKNTKVNIAVVNKLVNSMNIKMEIQPAWNSVRFTFKN